MISLRQRLLSTVGTVLVVIWLAVTVTSVLTTRDQARHLMDAQLARMAGALAAGVSGAGPAAPGARDAAGRYVVPVVYQVWSASGELLHGSPDAPVTPLRGDADGYGVAEAAGESWRYLTVRGAGGSVVHVASRVAERDALVGKAVEGALLPVFLALPLIMAGLWLSVGTCLNPLTALSTAIAARGVNNLDPVRVSGLPVEIRPLVAEVNAMLGRLEEAFGRFDRFAADAAHELRRPVTAIRSQAEAGLAGATAPERRHALEQILRTAEGCGALVEQILLLARLEGDAARVTDRQVELEAVARAVMTDVAPRALDKGLELSFQGEGPVRVLGNEELIRVLVRNLLDNAVRCTPAGGTVRLRVGRDAGGVHLWVEDTGPGIPARSRSQVLQRFCRLPEAVGEGYGIGLSIVERIAEVHRARVALEDGPQGKGLKVAVSFRA